MKYHSGTVEMVDLDLVDPAVDPVRTRWDQESLALFADNVREYGILKPVLLVQEENGRYRTIYGHRRIAAARMAGLMRVPAFISPGVPDEDRRVVAFVENEIRENMGPLDRARAIRGILEDNNWSQAELQRRGLMSQPTISNLLAFLDEHEAGVVDSDEDQAFRRTLEIRYAFSKAKVNDPALKRRVLEKSNEEGLNVRMTRKVADLVATGNEATKEAALETPAKSPAFDQLVRAKSAIYERRVRENEAKKKPTAVSKPVQDYINAMRSFGKSVNDAIRAAQGGMFSPESAGLISKWHVELADSMVKLISSIEAEENNNA